MNDKYIKYKCSVGSETSALLEVIIDRPTEQQTDGPTDQPSNR